MKFQSVFDKFLNFKYHRNDTVASYEKVVRQFLDAFPDIDIDDINQEKILEWRREKLRTIKPVTWNNLVRHLKAIYNFAIKQEYTTNRNPFNDISIKDDTKPFKILSDQQVFDAAKSIQKSNFEILKPIMLIFMYLHTDLDILSPQT